MFTVANDPIQLWSHRAGAGQLLGQICLRFVFLSTVRPEHNHTCSVASAPAASSSGDRSYGHNVSYEMFPSWSFRENILQLRHREQAETGFIRDTGETGEVSTPRAIPKKAASRKFPPPPLIPSMALLAAWGAPGPSFLPDSCSRVFSLPRFSEHTLKLHSLPSTPLPKFSRYHSYPLF